MYKTAIFNGLELYIQLEDTPRVAAGFLAKNLHG
jgi:hypothetical protein